MQYRGNYHDKYGQYLDTCCGNSKRQDKGRRESSGGNLLTTWKWTWERGMSVSFGED